MAQCTGEEGRQSRLNRISKTTFLPHAFHLLKGHLGSVTRGAPPKHRKGNPVFRKSFRR